MLLLPHFYMEDNTHALLNIFKHLSSPCTLSYGWLPIQWLQSSKSMDQHVQSNGYNEANLWRLKLGPILRPTLDLKSPTLIIIEQVSQEMTNV